MNPVFRSLAGRHGADVTCRPKQLARHVLRAPKWAFVAAVVREGAGAAGGDGAAERWRDGFQLLAKPSDPVAAAVKFVDRHAEDLGVDFVDVNLSCPAGPVVRSGRGGALLRRPSLVRRLVEEVRSHTSLPVTAKIRAGFEPGDSPRPVCEVLEDAGLAWVTVNRVPVRHVPLNARWGRDEYWAFREATRGLGWRTPVLANGGISTAEDAAAVLGATKCAGVLLGRAALGDHRIYDRIKRRLAPSPGRAPRPVEPDVSGLLGELFAEFRRYARVRGGRWSTIGQVKALVHPYLARAARGKLPRGRGRVAWQRARFTWETLREALTEAFPSVGADQWREWLPP
ncbi:MAG: hypothetical protein Kow0069_25550 [Promethearchaeota archaeon]